MTKKEMIEKFICPGCVGGNNTECGQYACPFDDKEEQGACRSHVVGTMAIPIGSFAIGLPKGFNRAGFYPYASELTEKHNKMHIWVWPDPDKVPATNWDKFNVPVWAMEKDGYLFVRTYRPRINDSVVEVINRGTLDMVPNAIDVSRFWESMD